MIEARTRRGRDGKSYRVWRVRWRDHSGAERSKTLPRGYSRDDAAVFEARVKLLKRTGELDVLDRGRETLASFAEEWWELYAGPNLARGTLACYAQVWNAHTLPRLGEFALRELTPKSIARFRMDLERDGVGRATVRKALTMLQGMLARAVEWERLATNPAALVPKPHGGRDRQVVVLAPERVETLRDELLRADRVGHGRRDATLISVLAYAGLRPWSEATALSWGDVSHGTVQVYAPKTRRERTVDLLGVLRQDLAEWRFASGRPDARELVFGQWTEHDIRNWRRRVWRPGLRACELDEKMVPYDLRHSFASLLIHEKRLSVIEVAEQLGHAPTMTSDTYGHVMRELRDTDPVSADEHVRRARERVAAGEIGRGEAL